MTTRAPRRLAGSVHSLMIAMTKLAITQMTMITCIQIQMGCTAPRLRPMRVLLLAPGGDHGRDRQAEPGGLGRQVELEPLGDALRQRRDDQLVEAVDVDRVLDRGQRLRDADHAVDGRARGLLEQRQRELERLLGLVLRLILGIDELVQAVRGVRAPGA